MTHAHADYYAAVPQAIRSQTGEIEITLGNFSLRMSDSEAADLFGQLEAVLSDDYARTEMLDAAPTTDMECAGRD